MNDSDIVEKWGIMFYFPKGFNVFKKPYKTPSRSACKIFIPKDDVKIKKYE